MLSPANTVEINQAIHAGMWFEATYQPAVHLVDYGLKAGERYVGKVLWGGGFDVLLDQFASDRTYHGFLVDFTDFTLYSMDDLRLNQPVKEPKYPTPERPLFVLHRPTIGQSVPSMKNDNTVDRRTGKVRRSEGTRTFLRSLRGKVKKRMATQGYSTLEPQHYASVVAYIRATNQDLDNMYTTVQEALQSTDQVKAFVPNDKQIKAFHPIYSAKRHGEEPMVIVFAWMSDERIIADKDCSSEEYFRWYNLIWRGRSLDQIVRQFGI